MSLPDWIIERMHLGEVPAAWRERVAAAKDDPEVARRLAELEADDEAILLQHPPARVADAVRARIRPRRRQAWLWAAPMVAAAAAVLIFLFARDGKEGRVVAVADSDAGIRLKGAPSLLIHRQTEDEPELLRRGDWVRAGDVLQLSYVARGARFGVILSIDGGGQVTRHWPEEDQARAAELDDRLVLPFSYELDDAPDFERFVFVTSATPFEVGVVLRAAHGVADGDAPRTAPLSLPATLSTTSFVVLKEAP